MKVRITKDPEVRKNEILDAASALFLSKGYVKTTVSDIIEVVDIAKGTFYYYFKSKEEVMNALAERFIDNATQYMQQMLDAKLPAAEKMRRLITDSGNLGGVEMAEQLHQANNTEMHLKSIVGAIHSCSHAVGEIVQQGINEGIYRTKYPREIAIIMLAASNFLFDEAIFSWKKDELARLAEAYASIIEQVLGVEAGGLSYIAESIMKSGVGHAKP
ncbi:MAG: TetR/AcrR family transcriptional regulator [Deferribacteraceae bacterium]|jgi:AcrR family transcriptional regulator|nr:TetR/AcrR family transcriptional regulator [Deferribacteraceae bacterium]